MRVLLGDDHPLYREALRLRLERTVHDACVVEASTLDEALDAGAEDPRFRLIVMDYNMPGMSIETGIPRLADAYPNVPIAIVSGVASATDVHRAVEAGVRGFLPKTMSPSTLSAALSVLLTGGTYLPVEILSALAGTISVPPAEIEPLPFPELSPRERDVMACIARGLSNKQIGRELNLSEVTVKLHARQIFRKIGVKNRAEAAVLAIRAGFA